MLISEMMEKVLDIKLLRKEQDLISEDRKFIHSETVMNEYTPKSMNIRNQKIHVAIKTSDEKILQESKTEVLYKTDKHGNISEQITRIDVGSEILEHEPVKYENKYDGKTLLYSIVRGIRHDKDGNPVAVLNRTAYKYDESKRIKLMICDCVPEDISKKYYNPSMSFIQMYVMEYDDEGKLVGINFQDIDSYNSDYKFEYFVVNYTSRGYIENIHRIGTDKNEDEYFQYYSDNSITVAKNNYDKDGTVIAKTILNFKF